MWGDDPVGVDQIPMELVLPHENGSATFGIAGVVAATSRTHVAAFVPGASQHGAWDMYDGMCTEWCRMGRNPRRWSCSFIGVVVMRTLTWMVWSAAWASTTRTRSVRRKVRVRRRTSSTHRSGRATRSHRQCRRKCPETSVAEERWQQAKENPWTPNATGSDMDEEDGETSMVELLRLVGEHLAQTHDGDETASLPHDPPASAENEEAAPQSEAGAEVDASTPNGDETASLPHDPPASAENEEAAPQSEARRWTHRHQR
ncbi:hypothetical protein ERJ75_000918500 [Trypanosoma vivax]|nr:hypothetical protein ERJ75_000918500 [Trypanosoma vivax]